MFNFTHTFSERVKVAHHRGHAELVKQKRKIKIVEKEEEELKMNNLL